LFKKADFAAARVGDLVTVLLVPQSFCLDVCAMISAESCHSCRTVVFANASFLSSFHEEGVARHTAT
jgi:hypothetical protein